MKSLPLLLAVSAALAVSGAAQATPREVDRYLDRASSTATAQLAAKGVTDAEGLRVKARVGGDGRLTGVHVATSTGSLETDQRAVAALRRLKVPNPPILLVGAEVVVGIDEQPVQTAKAN